MIFDKPKWPIVIRGKGTEKKGRHLYLYRDNSTEYVGKISIYMPSALYSLIYQVCKVEPRHTRMYLEKLKDRWVLGLETEDGLFDLWYYTKSTLPAWARRIL